jgi:hypothetical protein
VRPGEPAEVHVAAPAAPTYKEGALLSTLSGKKYETRATWKRDTLTPDVELHMRRPLSRDDRKLVDRMLDAARTIPAEEP